MGGATSSFPELGWSRSPLLLESGRFATANRIRTVARLRDNRQRVVVVVVLAYQFRANRSGTRHSCRFTEV